MFRLVARTCPRHNGALHAAAVILAALVIAGCGTSRVGVADVVSPASRAAAAREALDAFSDNYSGSGHVTASCADPLVFERRGPVARYPCHVVIPGDGQIRTERYLDHVDCSVPTGQPAVRAKDCRADVRRAHEMRMLQPDVERDRSTPASGRCPTGVLDEGDHAPEGVVRALRRAIPRIYKVIAYGKVQGLNPSTTEIYVVQSLGSDGVDLPGVRTFKGASSYWGTLARRRCPAIASRSWMALLSFSDAPAVSLSYRYAFLARTNSGWIIWDHD